MKKLFLPILFEFFLVVLAHSSNAQVGYITTIAGTGVAGYSGDGGAATNAMLNATWGVAVDGSGNVFTAEFNNKIVRKISAAGIISTVAGTGSIGFSGDGGPATNAMLANYPEGVAVDNLGNLFICDHNNNRIRKVNSMGIISTVAGSGINSYSGNGGPATDAALHNPADVAVDALGNIYIADEFNQVIRKVNSAGIISLFAGTNYAGFSGDGASATDAALSQPIGLAVDRAGNVFIADQLNNRVRKVDTNGIITTVVGTGTAGYSGDGGAATNAELYYPSRVAVDASGNIYIADFYNNAIRKVNSLGIISTVAGNGYLAGTSFGGYGGDNGPATGAELSGPMGVKVDGAGNIYIADAGNNRIRKVQGQSLSAQQLNKSSGFISVMPNPNKGSFIVGVRLSNADNNSISIDITNCIGQVVYNANIIAEMGLAKASIDLDAKLPKGVYIIRATTETGYYLSRFMID